LQLIVRVGTEQGEASEGVEPLPTPGELAPTGCAATCDAIDMPNASSIAAPRYLRLERPFMSGSRSIRESARAARKAYCMLARVLLNESRW